MKLEDLTPDQLVHFAILNWAADNRPEVYPPGGYVYAISSTRTLFLDELASIGLEAFIEKHKIRKFFEPTKGRKMAWTDEKKAKAVKLYKEAEPTPETSVEIVKEIAEILEETPNGVRMILSKEGVYVKKEASASTSTSKTTTTGGTRVSKSDSIQALKDVIGSQGFEVNDDVLDKLTGKQAVYLTDIFKKLIK